MADRFGFLSIRRMAAIVMVLVMAVALPAPVAALNVPTHQYNGNLPAGGTISYALLVGNPPTEEPVDVFVDVLGIDQKSNLSYAPVEPIQDTYSFSARKYISVDEKTVHLDPGAKKQVILTFQLPADVGDGGRYAMVVLHTLPGKNVTASDTNIPVFISIIGSHPKVTGNITDMTAIPDPSGRKLAVTTLYKNTGQAHQTTIVDTVTLSSSDGAVAGTNITGLPSSAVLLPDRSYAFVTTLDTSKLSPGTYAVSSTIKAENGDVSVQKSVDFVVGQNAGTTPVKTTAGVTTAPSSVPTTAKSPLPMAIVPVAIGITALLGSRRRR